jgi:hypothetical protein
MYWNLASVLLVVWAFLAVASHRAHGVVHLLLLASLALFATHVIQNHHHHRTT